MRPDQADGRALATTLQWMADPLGLLEGSAATRGEPFQLDFDATGPWLFFYTPDANRAVLNADPAVLRAGPANRILRPLLGASSLFFVDGQAHLTWRRRLKHPFEGRCLRNVGSLMSAATDAATAELEAGATIGARLLTQNIALDVILKTVIGGAPRPTRAALADSLAAALRSRHVGLAKLRRGGQVARPSTAAQWRARIVGLLDGELARRRRDGQPEHPDALSRFMLSARRANPASDEALRDQVLTLLVAGHDTTATALAWALYWLHSTPSALDRLRVALDPLGLAPDPLGLVRLVELDAVCRETLRIMPVIPVIARSVQQRMRLLDRTLEPGVTVGLAIYLTHRLPGIFEHPEQFRPERFIGRRYTPYQYLPFGGGVRRCLGQRFALYEMAVVLGTLLSRFEFELIQRGTVRPERRAVTIAPPDDVRLRVVGRKHVSADRHLSH